MKSLNRALSGKLERLKADYADAASDHRPFDHFYCPILFKDEDVTLCEAHVVNRAFPKTPRTWTVQRKDVDNFYGSNFEASFTALNDAHGRTGDAFVEVFGDNRLYKKLEPKILLEGEPVDFFFPNREVPDQFTLTLMEHNGKMIPIGLKMSREAVAAATDKRWEVVLDLDARLSAVVSLLKAAHLTLFEMLGYRYALSASGEFLGRQILGKFFLQNLGKPKIDVILAARSFFAEFINMIKPIASSNVPFLGTISDKKMFFCRASSGFFWAYIVFIKTGDMLNAVMVPVWDKIDLIPTFLDFLQNKNETIVVSAGQLQPDGWIIQKEEISVIWPKTEIAGLPFQD